jgi:5-methylcytosine-specific restriction protein A
MTPLLPTKRKPLTRRQRLLAHDKHGGTCCVCLQLIAPGEPFIDEHIIPLAIGGSNDTGNRGIAHIQCAKIKTQRDRKMIDKSARVRAKHLGIRKRVSRPIPGSKASGWRHKVSGEWVRR